MPMWPKADTGAARTRCEPQIAAALIVRLFLEGSRMKSNLVRRGIALVAMMCALVFASATTAVAAPLPVPTDEPPGVPLDLSQCRTEHACLWAHSGFRGGMLGRTQDENDFRTGASYTGCTHAGFNDCASSAYNNGISCTVYFFVNINYRGGYHSLSLGDWVTNFAVNQPPPAGYNDPSFNDAASSLKWCNPN